MTKTITPNALKRRLDSGRWRQTVTTYEKGKTRVQLVNTATGGPETRTVIE